MSLGPQCFTCRKRRVKCGSEEPTCLKCALDGHVCQAYIKPLQWRQVAPRDKLKAPRTIRKGDDNRKVGRADDNRQLVRQTQRLPRIRLTSEIEHQMHFFADAVGYFNTISMPDLSAVYWQTRCTTSVADWLQAPTLMQNMLVVSVLTTKSIKARKASPELYKYRGQVIKDLTVFLQDPEEQAPAVLLASLMGILQQEVHISPVGGFAMHLHAARRVVASCGGVRECLRIWPLSFDMIVMFIQVDVMSATTSSAAQLDSSETNAQYDYVEAFDGNFEDKLLDSALPCPLPVFECIIRVNNLRSQPPCSGKSPTSSWRTKFLGIAESIYRFDASSWSDKLFFITETSHVTSTSHPAAIKEWTYVALCYQAAAMIYLVESTELLNVQTEHEMDTSSAAWATRARAQLQLNLRHLFRTYPERKSVPECPTLWRFVQWPLMIYAYIVTRDGQGYHTQSLLLGEKSNSQDLYQELWEIGTAMTSNAVTDGASLYQKLAIKGGKLIWDEVFARRFVFYL